MTTRDPRFRAPLRPDSQGSGRDPTQSLSLPPEDVDGDDGFVDDPSHPSLALGTHDVGREERTKIESPSAQKKTPAPAPPRTAKPPPIPRGGEEPERVGSVLGSYRVLELLGKGGMGYVFRAEHVKLGREVALKLLRSDYARRRDAVARFFQEARTVNRVRHRNIVDVTDFVELPDGTTFIIMEFLRGQSLGKWARTGIDLPRALAVLVQICDGLGAAHQVGVIHRDLKPDNIIVVPTADGAELVKLLDFGVAKLVNRDDEDVGFQTAAGSVIGTPAYMSPEQAGGMAVDARSDIYSLGAIMYELFCGQPMFRGRSFGEYVRKHLTELPIPPRRTEAGASLDPVIEQLILRCLEKDPNQRFASILELRDALLGMLGGMETHPPGLANLTASGLRPAPLPALVPAPPTLAPAIAPTLVPAAMATVVPQIPMMQQLPTPGASQLSGISGISAISGAHPSVMHPGYTGYTGIVQPPPPQATPLWVWLVGGALAVGIGVTAAVWYAGSTAPPPSAAAQPAAPTPAITSAAIDPAAAAGPRYVELRFESTPSGGVFAEGGASELCRTPCTFNVDLRDGGSTERRAFVVKREGYKDGIVHVDLQGARREFALTLDAAGPTITAPAVDVAAPTIAPAPTASDDASDDEPARATRTRATKSTKAAKSAKIDRSDKPERSDAAGEPAATVPRPDPTPPEPKKVEPKRPTTDRIDKTETLDPFRKR